MIFIRGDGERIQIWPTIVYGFYLVLKSVTAAVGVIYACLLDLCKMLENYLSEITQTAIEHLQVSHSLVLHDYCIRILELERTCSIRKLCANHISITCNSIVTRRLFNIRLLYFVVFLSHEIKKFPVNALNGLSENERGYFKDLKTLRRHCLCWLNSSVHSLQSFILLHVCMHHVHCCIPITVGDITNIKETIINAFAVKWLESISRSTKSLQSSSENRCSGVRNLRQLTAKNVNCKLVSETRAIEFSQDNLTKAIGIVERTDGFKYVSRNLSFEGSIPKVEPSSSDCNVFDVTKKPEVLPETIFDIEENEISEQIIKDEHLLKGMSGTCNGDIIVGKVSEESPELTSDENKNNGSDRKTQQARTDEEYFIQGTQIDKLKVGKISDEISEELFDKDLISHSNNNEQNLSIKGFCTKVGSSTSDFYDFVVTKIPENLPENIFDCEENEESNQIIIENQNLLKEMSETSNKGFNVGNVFEESPEIMSDENKNNCSDSKTQQSWTDEEYFIQGTQIDKMKVGKISEEISKEIFDKDRICHSNNNEQNLSFKVNCTKVGPSTSDCNDFAVTKIPEELPENIFDCEENEISNQIEDKNVLKEMSETSSQDFKVENISEESSELSDDNKNNCSDRKTQQAKIREEFFLQEPLIDKLKVNQISEELPQELFDKNLIDKSNEELNLSFKGNCTKVGPSTSDFDDFVVTKLPEDLPENIFDCEENEKPNQIKNEDENVLKEMPENYNEDFKVGNVFEESLGIMSNENKNNCSESKTQLARPDEECFIQGIIIDNQNVDKISEEIPDDIFNNEDQRNDEVSVKLKTQVHTTINYVKEIETKPDHANRGITKQLRDTKSNLKEPVTTANAIKMDDSKNLKFHKEKPSEIRRVLSRHGISYHNFSKNRSLKNYLEVRLGNPPKVQKLAKITLDKIVIDIEDKTAISLLKHSDKPCEELTELKLLFYFALKGEVIVSAFVMKWVTYSSKYCMEMKEKHKANFRGWMIGLCIRNFVLDFCDFHFKNIKGKYEVSFYSRDSDKRYAFGFEKIDKSSVEKDNPDSIRYPFEFTKCGCKFVPYYDWELPVEDGIDLDEDVLGPIDPSIPEPKLATTACEFTVGFGTLPERLKKMLKIKHPNWSDHSGVEVQFPIMTPQEIAEDKGKQFVFLNWWNHYFSNTAAYSKPSIDDAFSSFLKRESNSMMKNEIEQNSELNENYALNIQQYRQEQFQRALIGEDVMITAIPDVSSTVKVNETPSTVPFRKDKSENGYSKVDVNSLVSNLQKIMLRKEESRESKIAESAVIDNDCNRLKQTGICNNVDRDQSKQNPLENYQEYNCNKKKSKSSRKKTGRNKHKKAIDGDAKDQGENTEEATDNKEDGDLILKFDSDQQKRKSSKETSTIRQTQVTVDCLMNVNTEQGVTIEKPNILIPKQLLTDEPINNLTNITLHESIDIKEPNMDIINDNVQKPVINNEVNDTAKKVASDVDKKTKKGKSKQKDVSITKEIKCNQNEKGINVSSDSKSTKKKKNYLNIAGNSIQISKPPIIPKREKSLVGISEEISSSSNDKASRDNTTINVGEIQNSSNGIVINQNVDDSAQIVRSNEASYIFRKHKSSATNKLCFETDKDLEVTRNVSKLNRAIEYNSGANSKPIKSKSSQFTSLLSTASCTDLNMKRHSEVLPQKTNEPVLNKPNSCGNNQTIHQPPLQREASQNVKTNDETMMTFKLYSDVVKQKKSVPDHSTINKVVNNQLVNLGILKLPQSKRKIFPTDPSSSASSTCFNSEVSSLTCTNTTATSMTIIDTSTSMTIIDTSTSTTLIDTSTSMNLADTTSMCSVSKDTSICLFDAITSRLCSSESSSLMHPSTTASLTCLDTNGSAFSSATVSSTYLGNTTLSMSLSDTTTSSMCSSVTTSTYLGDTEFSTCLIAAAASTCYTSQSASTSFNTSTSTILTTSVVSTCLSPTSNSTLLSFTNASTCPGDTIIPTCPSDTISQTCPSHTIIQTCPSSTVNATFHSSITTAASTFSSAQAASISFNASTLTILAPSIVSTYLSPTSNSTSSSPTNASTCLSETVIPTCLSVTVASTNFSETVASSTVNATLSSLSVATTTHNLISSTKTSLPKSDRRLSIEHENHLPAKVRRSPDQRQGLTVAQRLSAAFLRNKSEPVQNETLTKGFPEQASIKEETPTNSEETAASKHLPNKQISSELLARPSFPISDVPSTQISQEVVPEKPQINICGDPPNEPVSKEIPEIPSTECDANRNGNIRPKVHKNLLMTDSDSDSNDSSENSSPVAEYKFSGVRQKLRSDIALKLTDIMRKKVTSNK